MPPRGREAVSMHGALDEHVLAGSAFYCPDCMTSGFAHITEHRQRKSSHQSSGWRIFWTLSICDSIFFLPYFLLFCIPVSVHHLHFSIHVSFPCFLSSPAPCSLSTFPVETPLHFCTFSPFISLLLLYCSPFPPPALLQRHSRPTSTAAG